MSSTFRYWYADGQHNAPRESGWTRISQRHYKETDRAWDVPGFTAGPAEPPSWSADLLRCARAVYLADKLSRRSKADDGWTRTIHLSVPVVDPELWTSQACPVLERLLRTATGDMWAMEFHRATGDDVPNPAFYAGGCRSGEVTLFSGGLDSLSWALRRVSDGSRDALHLVTFNDAPLKSCQEAALRLVCHEKRRGRTIRRTVLPQELRERDPELRERDPLEGRLEVSSRTRGFLYAVAGLHVAAVNELPTVEVPENGQVAFNPPLSPARAGACSTRSVHPWTLHLLNQLISAVGGSVRVENPLWRETKGGVCAAIREAGVTPSEAALSVSCGRSPVHYGRSDVAHCGCCFPCLIRRSGLLHAYGCDATEYRRNPWDLPLPSQRRENEPTEDWRALSRWLRAPFTAADVAADLPLPPGWSPQHLHNVIAAGRGELSRLPQLPPGRHHLPEPHGV
ncbi:hypothetical protein [Streptomyces iconiensis]|uniref:7-cyano-7-deazaguanine synthase (Queuosine biosynthesis) n=1 Tax=Streptomyces iconiensis TaxID=1384038 RepID=A0ABT7A0X1_9ACTN|nr:hypothetical protein [Streptomyces iconiensis]MDJ1134956.1 hypothetical protein [Streptomyces iconiensis]